MRRTRPKLRHLENGLPVNLESDGTLWEYDPSHLARRPKFEKWLQLEDFRTQRVLYQEVSAMINLQKGDLAS